VSGRDYAGPVVGCAVPPSGKHGRWLWVGGAPVSRARVTGGQKSGAASRERTAARWSGLDYEPVERPRRGTQRKLAVVPDACAEYERQAARGEPLGSDVFTRCPGAESAAERFALASDVSPDLSGPWDLEQAPAPPTLGHEEVPYSFQAPVSYMAAEPPVKPRRSRTPEGGVPWFPRPPRRGELPAPFFKRPRSPELPEPRFTPHGPELEGPAFTPGPPPQTAQEALAARLREKLAARFGAPRGNPYGYARGYQRAPTGYHFLHGRRARW
jgi:hypothetical protein